MPCGCIRNGGSRFGGKRKPRKGVSAIADCFTIAECGLAKAELRATEGHTSVLVCAAIYAVVNIELTVVYLVFVPGFIWSFFPLDG